MTVGQKSAHIDGDTTTIKVVAGNSAKDGAKSDTLSNITSTATPWQISVAIFLNLIATIAMMISVKGLFKWGGFKFPLFVTSCHLLISWFGARVMIFGWGNWGWWKTDNTASTEAESNANTNNSQVNNDNTMNTCNCPNLSIKEQLHQIIPFSILGGLAIICGNFALIHIFPSLNEMLQCSTPIVVLLLSILFNGTRYNLYSYLAIVLVCAGSAMCSIGEVI
jgi:hypothetical protein